MPAKHTPTPWHVQPIGGQRYIEAQGPKLICDMQADECQNPAEVAEMEANAAFIVRACNCHEELVEALEMAKEFISERLQAEERQSRPAAWLVNDLRGKIFTINAAVAKAKSEAIP